MEFGQIASIQLNKNALDVSSGLNFEYCMLSNIARKKITGQVQTVAIRRKIFYALPVVAQSCLVREMCGYIFKVGFALLRQGKMPQYTHLKCIIVISN